MTRNTREYRVYRIGKLAAGLGMAPVYYVAPDGYTAGEAVGCYHVQCSHCRKVYRWNQRHYIRAHYQNAHGYTLTEAFNGTFGEPRATSVEVSP